VLLGKGPDFRVDLDVGLIDQVCAKHRVRKPYILFVGMIEPRKNLTRLIDAFATHSASYPEYTLVIAGIKGWMYGSVFEAVRRHKMEDRVMFTGFIDEQDKPYLIRGAEIFAYPSLYEGFGIPVLEAISCGIPTITSNISSLPEVAGDAALFVDPNSTPEISEALGRLMSDRALREELSRKCITQGAKFSWSRTASETYNVYEQAMVQSKVNN
jgi:glycosyltransferase involved in cell wall biosynthesis